MAEIGARSDTQMKEARDKNFEIQTALPELAMTYEKSYL
jgi:hypothetical protein